MKCINCGIAIQRLQRRLITSLSAHHQTKLSRWLTNAQIQLPLEIKPGFSLLNTEAGEQRLLGHNMACLGCGKSVRKIRHHNVSMDSSLLAGLISQNTINVTSRSNYVCHVCCMRAHRQTVQDLSRKLQELGSDNNAAAPYIQVVSPPEPPPLPPVLSRPLQMESTTILLPNYTEYILQKRTFHTQT
ncbi:unnamed protein product [Spodoptera exigua]|nr:unnamed protein product [Spodoptera exigua]